MPGLYLARRAGRKKLFLFTKKVLRLDPMAGPSNYNDLGFAFRMTGRYEEAATLFKKSIEMAPNDFWIHAHLAATYMIMGRDKEAHAAAAENHADQPQVLTGVVC